MDFLLVLLVMAAVVLVVAWPLYHAGRGSRDALPSDVAALEAARDAKFREIRDNELDHRTGKLSEADFRAVDERLRAEAVALLDALDAARAAHGGRSDRPAGGG